jgi:DNA repair exonuclease SbcCD ATPase subunit
MPITVSVQNFQSIEDATVVVDGFTAITGPNNTGKSALLRAVQGLFRNTKGTWFVRRGATHCTVKITLDDNTSVTWEKGKKGINRYRINDNDWMEKVSHGVPQPVVDILRVHAVTIGNTTCWPQVGEQFNGQVFLLDKPGSVLAEAVSDVERVGRLNKALKVAESDRRKARSTLRVRRRDEEQTQDKLVQFHGLDDVGRGIENLGELCAHAKRTRSALVELVRLRESLEREQSVIEKLSGVETIVPPDDGLFDEASSAISEHRFLIKAQADLERARLVKQTAQEAVDAFAEVEFDDEMFELAEKTLRSRDVLLGLQRDLRSASGDVESIQVEIRQVTGDLEASERELRGVLLEMPECPVCGADIEGREGLNHAH